MSPVINFNINNIKNAYVTASMNDISDNTTEITEIYKNSTVQKTSSTVPVNGIRPKFGQLYPR